MISNSGLEMVLNHMLKVNTLVMQWYEPEAQLGGLKLEPVSGVE